MKLKKIISRNGCKYPLKHSPIPLLSEQCAHGATTQVIHADCALALKSLQENSIDLVMTSPPYANQRKHTYGGVPPEKYVDWFLPIADELFRVLKPTGSFVLNIKENVVNGERHTYVMELIIALKKRGWRWTESYVWHKRNACPGKWPNRFRDAWERCEHFTKQNDFCMYQGSVMAPVKDWHKTRFNSLSNRDHIYRKSKTNSGFGVKMTNLIGRKLAYPDNVLHLASETRNQGHSAVFPQSLPEWFIKLFTKEGDTVLDSFMGSGTTLLVSRNLGRHSIGIDIRADYCILAATRLGLSPNRVLSNTSRHPIKQNLGLAHSNQNKDAKIKKIPKSKSASPNTPPRNSRGKTTKPKRKYL